MVVVELRIVDVQRGETAEATGRSAMAQEVEWTHIQYFAQHPPTPTVLIDAGGYDADRMEELARAAGAIGRIVIAVVPDGETKISQYADAVMPIKKGGKCRVLRAAGLQHPRQVDRGGTGAGAWRNLLRGLQRRAQRRLGERRRRSHL
ncbi:MAG: hypothetical protein U0528_19655 [Anaerolineae bacterium]